MTKKQWKTVVYLRISKAEGEGESNSIQNQRAVVGQYLRQHPECLCMGEFLDDGVSGRSFDRPAFRQMEQKLQRGEYDCLVVKDLSRLGRNYVETGRYVEQLFPLWGVRLVAVTDGVDTAEEMHRLFVPLKNLMNDWYSRDIGRKVAASWQVKREEGQFLGPFAPYGYEKKEKGVLLVAPKQAEVIRQAAQWVLEGASLAQVAKRLNDQGILSPSEQKTADGQSFFSGFRFYGQGRWNERSLRRMLLSPVYGGGRYWPALLSKEERGALLRLCHRDLRLKADGGRHLLAGLLFCGHCGRQVNIKTVKRGETLYRYGLCAGAKEGVCALPLLPLGAVEDCLREVWQACPRTKGTEMTRKALVLLLSSLWLTEDSCRVVFAKEAALCPEESVWS